MTARRVTIRSHANHNNDGFDIEAKNLLIEDCDVDATDDAFCFKSDNPDFVIENCVIRRCKASSACNFIKVGTSSYGQIRNLLVEDMELSARGVSPIWDWRKVVPWAGVTNRVSGLAGVALEVVDGGRMEDVTVRNIKMLSGVQTPILIRHARRHQGPFETCLRNILIENITGSAISRIASSITGVAASDKGPVLRPENITIRNIDLTLPGGGTVDLAGGFPSSKEGLAAWDNWVDALTKHFRGRVNDWLMWNEPDIVLKPGEKPKTVKDIAALNARTARIIRRNQPDARIAGLSLANHNAEYFDECITALGEDAKLFDTFIYHGYEYAPEATSEEVERQKQVLARHGLKAKLWQGESVCPSEKTTKFALPNVDWTEYSQAKWDLRRMLEDLGHDVVSSVFTICDFNHIGREINRKGLVKADENHKVIGVKRAYYSVQNVVSLFDDTVVREQGEPKFVFQDQRLNTYSYLKDGKTPVLVFWLARHATTVPQWPDNSFKLEKGEFTYRGQALVDPVWIDLLTGKVYELPVECQQIANGVVKFCKIPFYDSPCVLTERAAVKLQKSE